MNDPKLTSAEIIALREAGTALARVMKSEVRDSLLAKGLITQKIGGYVRTPAGDMWLLHHG